MDNTGSQTHNTTGSQSEDFLLLQKYIQSTKYGHFNKIEKTLLHDAQVDNAPKFGSFLGKKIKKESFEDDGRKKRLSIEQKKILEETKNNILIGINDPFEFYGTSAEYIKKYYDIFKRLMPEATLKLESCLYIFEKMSLQDIRFLSKDMDYESFQNILINRVISQIGGCYKEEIQTKDILESLAKNVYDNIIQLDSYKLVKKAKHFATSTNKIESHVKDFFAQEKDGLKKILQDSIFFWQTKIEEFQKTEEKEFLVAFIPFVLDFFYDARNMYGAIIKYIYVKREAAIYDEIQNNQSKNNETPKKATSSQEDQSVEVTETANKSSIVLSEGEQSFITYVQDIFDDPQLQVEVGKYLTRIFKKNQSIRLLDWMRRKNVSLNDNKKQILENIFIQHGYQEKSTAKEERLVDSKQPYIMEEEQDKKIETLKDDVDVDWNGFLYLLSLQGLKKDNLPISLEKEYDDLTFLDKKSLHDKLQLAQHHPDIYRDTRPNKYKILKFGSNLSFRLIKKNLDIISIQSRSGNYDPYSLYNTK